MPKLRRLSIVAMDPEKLADFYVDVFGMRRIANPRGEALYLTDGYFNLTLIPNRAEGKPNGLNHLGFEIEDEAEIAESFRKWKLKDPSSHPGKRSFADLRGTDPEGNNIDISARGFPHKA